MEIWIIWIIIAVLMIIIEVLTQMLWAFCLGVGALGAMISSFFNIPTPWQVVIMACVGLLAYVILLPWFHRYNNSKMRSKERTGMEALLGRKAIITEEIKPGHVGRARIDGDNWQVIAPSATAVIPRGAEVTVTGYDSIILTVVSVKSV